MTDSIPILLYHRIEESADPIATSPQEFRRHLQWLHQQGWRSLTIDELTYYLGSRKAPPPRSFAITFDDGYESLAASAFETLKEFQFSATCFIATWFLTGASDSTRDAVDAETGKEFLSWDQVRALHATGLFDFQSHSHTHRDFRGWERDRIRADIELSREILAFELALPHRHFSHLAWPWGLTFPDWRAVAKDAGFNYQYIVARHSFVRGAALDEIPRTCCDAVPSGQFQRQFWLQSGQLAQLWNFAYPFGRRLRQLAGLK
jgi:peptidoglycan/xylan/chitin deacetylase (PgdA/CDA1 family)